MRKDRRKSKINKENPAISTQMKPQGKGVIVLDLVMQDFKDRAEVGEKRYGEKLKTFNGRSALTDAYQEAIDLVMYLRQLLEEEKVSDGNS